MLNRLHAKFQNEVKRFLKINGKNVNFKEGKNKKRFSQLLHIGSIPVFWQPFRRRERRGGLPSPWAHSSQQPLTGPNQRPIIVDRVLHLNIDKYCTY